MEGPTAYLCHTRRFTHLPSCVATRPNRMIVSRSQQRLRVEKPTSNPNKEGRHRQASRAGNLVPCHRPYKLPQQGGNTPLSFHEELSRAGRKGPATPSPSTPRGKGGAEGGPNYSFSYLSPDQVRRHPQLHEARAGQFYSFSYLSVSFITHEARAGLEGRAKASARPLPPRLRSHQRAMAKL